MVKKALSYLLLAVLMVNVMAYQCVYVFFKANQKYIAATLCIKREVKGNTCQGKCQLKKMAQATESGTHKMLEELKVDFICNHIPNFDLLKPYHPIKEKMPLSEIPSLQTGYPQVAEAPPDFIS